MRQSGKLYGMLVMALCLAAATAISLACLGKASELSHEAYAQDAGLVYVQTAADDIMAMQGVYDGTLSYYDADMTPCGEAGARYAITCTYGPDGGVLWSGTVSLIDLKDGHALVTLPVAWACDYDGTGGDGHE